MRPWATIEAITAIAAMSKISLPLPTPDFSTKRAKSIEATPFGPNHAMKSCWAEGSLVRMKESSTAAGLAIRRAKATKAMSGGMS